MERGRAKKRQLTAKPDDSTSVALTIMQRDKLLTDAPHMHHSLCTAYIADPISGAHTAFISAEDGCSVYI